MTPPADLFTIAGILVLENDLLNFAGPTVWNSLPEDMRDPDVSEDSYRQSLKTFLFSQYYTVSQK